MTTKVTNFSISNLISNDKLKIVSVPNKELLKVGIALLEANCGKKIREEEIEFKDVSDTMLNFLPMPLAELVFGLVADDICPIDDFTSLVDIIDVVYQCMHDADGGAGMFGMRSDGVLNRPEQRDAYSAMQAHSSRVANAGSRIMGFATVASMGMEPF